MAKIYKRESSPYWWCIIQQPTGGRLRRSTKCKAESGLKKKAQLIANDWESQLWRDYKPGQENETLYYFDDLMLAWIDDANPNRSDLYNIKQLKQFFSGKCLNHLSADDINAYKKLRQVKDSTLRRELSVFRSAINYAIQQWEWVIPNPVVGRVPPPGKNVIRWLTKEEAARLRAAAQQKAVAPAYLINFIDLGLNTGMRKMEMLELEVDRIDLRSNVIHLKPEHQKAGTHSTIPINANARNAIVRQLPNSTKYLFPGKLEGSHLSDVKNPFTKCVKRAQIENFRVHDLRHTFASWLVQAGVDLYRVKELMRHSSVTQTEKYAHLAPHHTASSVDLLSRYCHADGSEGDNITDMTGKLVGNQ